MKLINLTNYLKSLSAKLIYLIELEKITQARIVLQETKAAVALSSWTVLQRIKFTLVIQRKYNVKKAYQK